MTPSHLPIIVDRLCEHMRFVKLNYGKAFHSLMSPQRRCISEALGRDSWRRLTVVEKPYSHHDHSQIKMNNNPKAVSGAGTSLLETSGEQYSIVNPLLRGFITRHRIWKCWVPLYPRSMLWDPEIPRHRVYTWFRLRSTHVIWE